MRATEIVLHFDKREIEALQNALDCFSDESCTVEQKLRERGVVVGRDVQVVPLKRKQPSDLYELE